MLTSLLLLGLLGPPASADDDLDLDLDDLDLDDEDSDDGDEPPPLEELVEAEPEPYKLKKRWIDFNTRGGASLGVYQMTATGSQDVALDAPALSLWVHAGDRFFGILGYYVHGRGSLMGFDEVAANGEVYDNYNETSIILLEGGAGVDVYIVPRIVSLSAEGFYGVFGATLQPVDTSHLLLDTEAYGFGWRARAAVQHRGFGVHLEYQQIGSMTDKREAGLTWSGWQAGLGLSFDPSSLVKD